MNGGSEKDITRLIAQAREGKTAAQEQLYGAVYDEFRSIARGLTRARGPDATLGATALANEVYLEFERRFPPPPDAVPESRRTFYRSVALAMRSVLRDHARAMDAAKRGGGWKGQELNESVLAAAGNAALDPGAVLDLEEAVTRLEAEHPGWAEVLIHRYYAGLTIEETARVLEISPASVSRHWALARAWMQEWFKADGRADHHA